jgi:hypothetical protein
VDGDLRTVTDLIALLSMLLSPFGAVRQLPCRRVDVPSFAQSHARLAPSGVGKGPRLSRLDLRPKLGYDHAWVRLQREFRSPTHYEIVPSLTAVDGCRWLTRLGPSVRTGKHRVLPTDVG